MKINNFNPTVGDVGIRFFLFRRAIKKSMSQLAFELDIDVNEIETVEDGTSYPEINYLHYLRTHYGLNINWMLCKEGEMFVDWQPPDVDTYFIPHPPANEGDPEYEKQLEFLQLMKVPVIKEAILNSLRDIKEKLKKEV